MRALLLFYMLLTFVIWSPLNAAPRPASSTILFPLPLELITPFLEKTQPKV